MMTNDTNMSALGNLLHFELSKRNPLFSNLGEEATSSDWAKINSLVSELTNELNLTYPTQASSQIASLRESDKIKFVSDGVTHNYIVTKVFSDGAVRTWPLATNKDIKILHSEIKLYEVTRCDLSKINNEKLKELVDVSLPDDIKEALVSNDERFETSPATALDSHLQIGDITFDVDPTTLAFTFQNGYKIFPTIRTQGNPKLPTMEHVKNIDFSLIFPNADSINYQLLNLLAMFKRTPVVNLRNKEISSFFQELTNRMYGWMPVALETITIQSIEGFPSSLQANITVLPIDPAHFGSGLQAMKSMADVALQQDYYAYDQEFKYQLDKAKATLKDNSIDPSELRFARPIDIVPTYDFKESVPFRTFYQSIILDNKVVKNQDGSSAATFTKNGALTNRYVDLEDFRPKNKMFALRHYNLEANREPVKLTYSYIDSDPREVSKLMSESRINLNLQEQKDLSKYVGKLSGYKDLGIVLFNEFHTTDVLWRSAEFQFGAEENVIDKALAQRGWDVTSHHGMQIRSLFSYLCRGVTNKFNITAISNTIRQAGEVASQLAPGEVAGQLTLRLGSEKDWSLLYGGLTHTDTQESDVSRYGITTFEGAIKELYDWIKLDPTGKREREFYLILNQIAAGTIDEINDRYIVVEEDNNGEYVYKRQVLPIKNEQIVIDGKNDVITSWQIVYANKFIPIATLGTRYPFYQHIGSEDMVLSMGITSVNPYGNNDLKAKLSLLSDRIHDSTKIIMYNIPDLYLWMDPRIYVDVPDNHLLSSFGLRKLVLNSSNFSNIQGQPNSWRGTVNFTQAAFSLEQYHSQEQLYNTSNIEEIMSLMFVRMSLVNDRVVVHDYFKKIDQDGTEEPVTDMTELVILSFANSASGKKLLDDLTQKNPSDTTGGNLLEEFMNIKSEIGSELIRVSENKIATSVINDLITSNEFFGITLKGLLAKYEILQQTQADVINQLIQEKKEWWEFAISNTWSNAKELVGRHKAALVFMLATGIMFPKLGAGYALGGIGAVALDTVKSVAAQEIKERMSSFFSIMTTNVKKDLVRGLSHLVMKDPPIRDRILDPRLTNAMITRSDDESSVPDYRKVFNNVYNSTSSAFGDFDVDYRFSMTDGRQLSVAPDFYLYNYRESFLESKSYVDNAEKMLEKTARLALSLCYTEQFNNVVKLKDLLDVIEGNQVIKQQFETLKIDDLSYIQYMKDEMKYRDFPTSAAAVGADYITLCTTDQSALETSDSSYNTDANAPVVEQNEEVGSVVQMWEDVNKNTKQDANYLEEKKFIENLYSYGYGGKILNRDLMKFHYVYTARMKTMLELFSLFAIIEGYFSDIRITTNTSEIGSLFKSIRDNNFNETSVGYAKDSIMQLRESIMTTLSKANTLTTSVLNSDDKGMKKLKDNYKDGVYIANKENDKSKGIVSIPEIRNLQTHVYNTIGYYIRLNSAIEEYYSSGSSESHATTINLESLPELSYLDIFNIRTAEETSRKAKILKDYRNSVQNSTRETARIYPTFRLLFVEEDTHRSLQLDDYYAYHAVQSIQIAKNKDLASKTAVIRISNIVGSVTDRLTLHREKSDLLGPASSDEPDEAHFGTLDVKPGTLVIIQLGYSNMTTGTNVAFVGRIVEMNVGPECELICQSFGAGLNHRIMYKHFGMLSSEKEHGDIASSILESIPGLEKFGKRELYNLGLASKYSMGELKNRRHNMSEQYFLSSILGKLTSILNSSDNPRDENIYLTRNLISETRDLFSTIAAGVAGSKSTYYKPRFDWVVDNQTVWNALKELALYHQNCEVYVRPYNTDALSNFADRRETLVIGNKSGYYKYTDAFEFSSRDYDKLKESISKWNSFKDYFLNEDIVKSKKKTSSERTILALHELGFASELESQKIAIVTLIKKAFLKQTAIDMWKWLEDPFNVNILLKHILSLEELQIGTVIGAVTESLRSNPYLDDNSLVRKLTVNLQAFSTSALSIPNPLSYNYAKTDKLVLFGDILYYLNLIKFNPEKYNLKTSQNLYNFTEADFFDVDTRRVNTDPELVYNAQYKRIQNHHLITDSRDIIQNDLVLNSTFSNTINVYYFSDAASKKESDGFKQKDIDKLNLWSIKAFGDIRDEHIRPLDSYQKNIDPDWAQVRSTIDTFFGKYKAMYKAGLKNEIEFKKVLKDLNEDFPKEFNVDTPDWRMYPSFVTVGVNLLKNEVSKMYQGTITIVGNSEIEPGDIVHIEDFTNDMHGVVEVEEVILSFTPDRGYITTIVPNMIVYDRDPIQLEDVAIINRIFTEANNTRTRGIIGTGIGIGATTAGMVLGLKSIKNGGWKGVVGGLAGIGVGASMAYNGVKSMLDYHKFLYEQLGKVLGRDCINFSTLMYHGAPYICGFDGLDYSSLKTMINHKVEGTQGGILTRYAAFSDPFQTMMETGWKPSDTSIMRTMFRGRFMSFFRSPTIEGQMKNQFNDIRPWR